MALDTMPTSGDGESAFTEAQLAEAQRLMEEVPRIDAALKNFLSLRMAEAMAPGVAAGAGAAALQGCARALLRAINALELPPPVEWGHRHPQQEAEAGMDFMSRLGAYKVVAALWGRCRSAGQKPSKLLGRGALRVAYPEVAAQFLAEGALGPAARSAGASEEQLRAFVEAFGRAVAGGAGAADGAADGAAMEGVEAEAGPEGAEAGPEEEADLVWAADMGAALAARREARQAEAAARVQRATSADAFSDELRSALAAQGVGASSSVMVEEVDD